MKTKFFLLTFIAWLILLHPCFPAKVSEDQARLVAARFFMERISQYRGTLVTEPIISKTFNLLDENILCYYIFNFESGGFIAVSANDAAVPVLFYSFDGNYQETNQPENFKAWIKQYELQLRNVIENNLSPEKEVSDTWNRYLGIESFTLTPFDGRNVLPLLTTTWDQGNFYNQMCPSDPAGPGGHCVTGCVATAMGQLVNYFRWPDTGTGSYSYECPPYGTLSANFDSTIYQWELIEPSLTHSNLSLAEVLSHLGISVDMVYGPNGSGMYNHKAAYSLRTYFKYSPETQYVFRDSTTMDWDSLIISHLDRHIPMYYAGWSVPNIEGHAFICDGYQGENYYHFNWGWSGSYDGYFYTDNLTPGGSNFNLAQELIINAVPDTNLYIYPIHCQGLIDYSALYGTIEDGSGPIYNYENQAECSWLIAPDDSVNSITLHFQRFTLQPGDTLKVYDGDTIIAPLIGIYSGADIPSDLTSAGSKILITFDSDSTGTEEGFLASWKSNLPVYCTGNTTLTALSDTISDGSGPWNYHDNSLCQWLIMPSGATTVTLFFNEFETEAYYDLLKIYDLESQQLLAEYSGSYAPGLPDPVTSPSGKLFLAFITNYYGTAAGWEAYYLTDYVGVPENEKSNGISLYPNPSEGMINISFQDQIEDQAILRISDPAGKVISYFELPPAKNRTVIRQDLGNLAPGIYICTIISGRNSWVEKISVK